VPAQSVQTIEELSTYARYLKGSCSTLYRDIIALTRPTYAASSITSFSLLSLPYTPHLSLNPSPNPHAPPETVSKTFSSLDVTLTWLPPGCVPLPHTIAPPLALVTSTRCPANGSPNTELKSYQTWLPSRLYANTCSASPLNKPSEPFVILIAMPPVCASRWKTSVYWAPVGALVVCRRS
jgi:hypothetical protein